MKKIVIAALALSVATSVASPSAAEEAKAGAPEMPKPAAELSQLKWFAGSWTCSGKTFQNPMGPEHASLGKVTIRPDLGGFWYSVRYEEQKTTGNPMPYRVAAFWGYDANLKKFVAGAVDGMGGYSTQNAPGWEGDKLVFTGDALGMGPNKMPARDTFTKKGENEMIHTGEMSMTEGQWMKIDEETCHRSGSTTTTKSTTTGTKTEMKTETKTESVKK